MAWPWTEPFPDRAWHAGLLAGARRSSKLSLNGDLGVDWRHIWRPGFDQHGTETSVEVDLAFNPLLHFPFEPVQLVVGAESGLTFGYLSDEGGAEERWWGLLLGLDGGVFVPGRAKASVGAFWRLALRHPMSACPEPAFNQYCGGPNGTEQHTSFVFSLGAAALF